MLQYSPLASQVFTIHITYKLKTNYQITASKHQAQYLDLKYSLRANTEYKNYERLKLQVII